jgi:hypothetical protein
MSEPYRTEVAVVVSEWYSAAATRMYSTVVGSLVVVCVEVGRSERQRDRFNGERAVLSSTTTVVSEIELSFSP